jgi:UDP-N-acetylglucosamine 1-carboxyvinyltransferase
VNVVTEPFPGFPTDLQAQMMAMLCTADGTSVLEERIFENRFMHAPELMRMGARIDLQGGNRQGHRGGAAARRPRHGHRPARLRVADPRALGAEGETMVSRVYHLDRGYEHVEEKLSAVGARIERIAA